MSALQNVMDTLQSIWPWLLLLLPGLSKAARDNTVEKVIDIASLFEQLGRFLDEDRLDKLLPSGNGESFIAQSTIKTAVDTAFSNVSSTLTSFETTLKRHAKLILKRLEPKKENRPWIVFGFLFQLIFLLLFSWADTIQIFNNIVVVIDPTADVPPLFQNLTISLIMSSVGVAIATGFIFAEFSGITHFGGWNKLEGNPRKIALAFLWMSFISIIVIDVIIAVARITTIPAVVPYLSPEIFRLLTIASAIAASVVVIPMLLTTFLFLQGFLGVIVLYVILISLLAMIIGLARLVFSTFMWLITYGLAYIIVFVLKTFLWVLTALLHILGWTLVAAGTAIVKFIELAQSIMDMVYLPVDSIMEWVGKLLMRFISKAP